MAGRNGRGGGGGGREEEEEEKKKEEEEEKEEKEKKFLRTGSRADQSKVVQEVLADLKSNKTSVRLDIMQSFVSQSCPGRMLYHGVWFGFR